MRLIDADGLIEKRWDVDCRVGYVQVVDVGDIKNAPTVDAYPVIHARWKGPDEPPYIKGAVCTNCGGLAFEMGNFCGNCGAKMDLKKNEET